MTEPEVHRTRSKIARLSAEIRHELNMRIRDGELATTLLPWLNGLPEARVIIEQNYHGVDITPDNLSTWRTGRYRDWLERREQLEEKRELADYCFELAESGKSLLDGTASIMAGKLMEVIESVDVEAQRELLQEKPDSLTAIVASLTRLQGQANQHYKLKQTDRRLNLDERKFEARFLQLFEKYYADRQVQEIMAGKDAGQVKMDQLRTHIFGAPPRRS